MTSDSVSSPSRRPCAASTMLRVLFWVILAVPLLATMETGCDAYHAYQNWMAEQQCAAAPAAEMNALGVAAAIAPTLDHGVQRAQRDFWWRLALIPVGPLLMTAWYFAWRALRRLVYSVPGADCPSCGCLLSVQYPAACPGCGAKLEFAATRPPTVTVSGPPSASVAPKQYVTRNSVSGPSRRQRTGSTSLRILLWAIAAYFVLHTADKGHQAFRAYEHWRVTQQRVAVRAPEGHERGLAAFAPLWEHQARKAQHDFWWSLTKILRGLLVMTGAYCGFLLLRRWEDCKSGKDCPSCGCTVSGQYPASCPQCHAKLEFDAPQVVNEPVGRPRDEDKGPGGIQS